MIRHRLFADDIFFHILHGAPGAWQHAGAWQQTYAQCLLKSWGLFQVLATSRMFTGSFSSSGPDFHLSLFFSLSFFPILLFLGKLYKLMWQNEHTHTQTHTSNTLLLSFTVFPPSHTISPPPPAVDCSSSCFHSLHISLQISSPLWASVIILFSISAVPLNAFLPFLSNFHSWWHLTYVSRFPRAPSFCILSVSSSRLPISLLQSLASSLSYSPSPPLLSLYIHLELKSEYMQPVFYLSTQTELSLNHSSFLRTKTRQKV